jgi:hypothetical protein
MQNDVVAQIISGISTLGFVIFFGIAAALPMIYEMTVLRKQSVKLLLHFPYRFISRLCKTGVIGSLVLFSFLFIISGFLVILFELCANEMLLTIALYIVLFNLAAIIVVFAYIIIISLFLDGPEMQQIMSYVEE